MLNTLIFYIIYVFNKLKFNLNKSTKFRPISISINNVQFKIMYKSI